MTTFRDYLTDSFARNYTGTDDAMPDKCEDYISNMSRSELAENFLAYIDTLSDVEVARIAEDLIS